MLKNGFSLILYNYNHSYYFIIALLFYYTFGF